MEKGRSKFSFFGSIVLSIILSYPLYAQWTEPVPITNDLYLITPSAVTAGDTLHVVGHNGIRTSYLRSPDNGYSWTEPILPAEGFYHSSMPFITASNNYIHIAFIGRVEVNQELQAYIMSSSDGGRNWENPRAIFNNDPSGIFKYPRFAVKNDTLFFSCMKTSKILIFRSFDNGITWQDSTIAESDPGMINAPPILLYSDNRLHLVYQFNIGDDSLGIEIFHRYSDDFGLTWSDRIPLSELEPLPNMEHGQCPSAYADNNGNIIAAWYDYKYGSYCGTTGDILARISTDNGETWLPESRITFTQSGNRSSGIILNGKIYMTWMDYFPVGCSCPKIMYSESEDWGLSWTEPVVITGEAEIREYFPCLNYTADSMDTIFHCVISRYYDETPRNDFFYLRSEPFVSIQDNDLKSLPADLKLSAYPNPFNSTTLISFSNLTGNDLKLNIYNLNGQIVKTFNPRGQKEGNIIWDATDDGGREVSTGIYFARAQTPQGFKSIKLLYVK